jgi:signal transduction histidine kinase
MAVAITSIVVFAFVLPLGVLIRTVARDRAVNAAKTTAQSFVFTEALANVDPDSLQAAIADTEAHGQLSLTVYLPDGTVVGSARHPLDATTLSYARSGNVFNRRAPGGIDVVVSVVEPKLTTSVVQVFVPDSELSRGVFRAWLILGSLAALLILVAAVVADRIARSITRPLRDAARVANELAGGDLGARAEPQGTDEVLALTHALNLLAERIGELLQAERDSVADLSHRLRTPVTALRLMAEQLGDPAERIRVTAELDRFEDALNSVIRQARAPITHDLGADLVAAVRDRMAFWSVLGAAQHRNIVVRLPATTVPVNASRQDLDSVIDAIVGNVFQHTPNGVACSVEVGALAGQARLVVDDAGPGLPGHDVTVRGRRGPRSRGTGLGLDIARRVAERSGGRILTDRSPLGGARVAVTIGAATSKLP